MPISSAKNKIYLVCAVWIFLCGLMFFYLFTILDKSNEKLVNGFAEQLHQTEVLQAEQESYKQANADLNKVKTEKYQPEDLFSKDVSLVNELKTLENLGLQSNIKLEISGLSGTVQTAPKAGTKSNIRQIPYGLTLTGSLNNCIAFMETLEHLKFVTTINSLTVTTGSDIVNINLSGLFYLRPQ
jgi:hypothetical protein